MNHIIELTMNVSNDDDGLLDTEHVRLISVDICHFVENADKTILLNVSLEHEMLANKVHLWHSLSYSIINK